jgi:insertion element IS1 protein InsB
MPSTDESIVALLVEGCGIRGISRLMKISSTTVIVRIKAMGKAKVFNRQIPIGKEYEVDEMRTYIFAARSDYTGSPTLSKEVQDA